MSKSVQGTSTHIALQVSQRKHLSKQPGVGGNSAFDMGTLDETEGCQV